MDDEREAAAHHRTAAKRARAFAGRETLRASVCRMLVPSSAARPGRPKVGHDE